MAYEEENNKVLEQCNINQNSVNCCVTRAGGYVLKNEVTLSANNTAATMNIFKINGVVEIESIYGEVTDATTLVNCTGIHIDVYDGTNTVDLCTTGAAISGMSVGTMIVKDKDDTNDLTVLDNCQCRVLEKADKKAHQPFTVLEKDSTSTYLRFTYSTTDAPINAKIEWIVTYTCVDGGSMEVA